MKFDAVAEHTFPIGIVRACHVQSHTQKCTLPLERRRDREREENTPRHKASTVGAIIESTQQEKSPPRGPPRSLGWRYVQKFAVCAHLTFNQTLMLSIELNHDKKKFELCGIKGKTRAVITSKARGCKMPLGAP
jgi:hypothetical protein